MRMTSLLSSSDVLTACYLLHIPVFSARHCVLPLLSVVAIGIPGHAGGWHLRRKPCVVLLPFLFPYLILRLLIYARVMLFLRLLRCRCLSHRHHGKHRNPRIQLVLGNVLRHLCLHCCHDIHVIVWNYPSPVMLYCKATRIFTCQVQISLPCGVK